MPQTIASAIVEIAEVVAAASGINAPQATPRENTNEYPFAMVYLFDGQSSAMSQGWKIDLVNIAIDILTPRSRDLNESLPALHAILDTLLDALWSEVAKQGAGFFDGSIDTFGNLSIAFLPFYVYANVEMIGYRLVLEQVKLVATL